MRDPGRIAEWTIFRRDHESSNLFGCDLQCWYRLLAIALLRTASLHYNKHRPNISCSLDQAFTLSFFSLHNSHASAMTTFNPNPIHSPPINPASDFVKYAPEIAPAKSNKAPKTLRFRSGFSPNGAVKSCASLIKSQYKLVNTTVGIALYFNTRLATICPALWNASSATGPKSDAGNPLGKVKVRNSASLAVTTSGG